MEDYTNYRTLGERIRRVRKNSRLSQKAFSKLCGVSALTLMRYETGNRGPDSRFLLRLSENFNVNANWLLREMGEVYLGAARAEDNGQPLDTVTVSALFQEFADFLKSRVMSNGDSQPWKPGNGVPRDLSPGVLIVTNDRLLATRIRASLGPLSVEILDSDCIREAEHLMEFRTFSLVVIDSGLGREESRKLVERVRGGSGAGVLLLDETRENINGGRSVTAGRLEYLDRQALENGQLLQSAGRLLSSLSINATR